MGSALLIALVLSILAVFSALVRAGATRPARRDPTTGELVLQCGSGVLWTMGSITVGVLHQGEPQHSPRILWAELRALDASFPLRRDNYPILENASIHYRIQLKMMP
jgi:hypothetical protein